MTPKPNPIPSRLRIALNGAIQMVSRRINRITMPMQLVLELLQLDQQAATIPRPLVGTRCDADDLVRLAMSHSTVSFNTSRISGSWPAAHKMMQWRNFSFPCVRQQY